MRCIKPVCYQPKGHKRTGSRYVEKHLNGSMQAVTCTHTPHMQLLQTAGHLSTCVPRSMPRRFSRTQLADWVEALCCCLILGSHINPRPQGQKCKSAGSRGAKCRHKTRLVQTKVHMQQPAAAHVHSCSSQKTKSTQTLTHAADKSRTLQGTQTRRRKDSIHPCTAMPCSSPGMPQPPASRRESHPAHSWQSRLLLR